MFEIPSLYQLLSMVKSFFLLFFFFIIVMITSMSSIEFIKFTGAQGIGVSYPRNADNLPPARKAIRLCTSNNIQRIRLYNPSHDALHALKSTGIEVILGVPNDDIKSIAYNPRFAKVWVNRNVGWYAPYIDFRCIAVGDDWTLANTSLRDHLLPAMKSLQRALKFFNLSVAVTAMMHPYVIPSTFPPSAGSFAAAILPLVIPIVQFLQANRYPLLYAVDSYVIFLSDISYSNNTTLQFALLNTTEAEIQDGKFQYTNILDAQVDAAYYALEKAGAYNVEIIVAETGWRACKGAEIATYVNAETYNNNLIKRLRTGIGTPKRPGKGLECYIYSLFTQDFYHGRDCYGLFYPNMTEVYPLDFWYTPPL